MTKVGLPIKSTGEKSSFEEMIGGSDAGELPATRLCLAATHESTIMLVISQQLQDRK